MRAPTILQGNCFEPDRTLPYAPLLDLLDTFIGSLPPTDIPAALGTAATDLAKLIPALAPLIPDLAPAPALDTEQEKRHLFQALAQFFLRLAEASPLLVIIEDIHWCDDTSLDFFLFLARRIVHAPIVVVFTYYAAGAWQPAFVYTRQVGERAAALHAPRAAAEHFTHAIEAAHELEATPSGELYRARGLVYGILGDFEHARDDHELALHIARAAADRRAEWRSLMDLGDLWAGHDYRRAGAFFRDAAALVQDLDDPAVHARSLNRLANSLINIGEPDESLRVHEEALRIFSDTSDRQGMAETFDLLGAANGIAGATVDSVRHFERAIALLRDGGETKLLSSSLARKALYAGPSLSDVKYFPGGDPDVGLGELDEALRLARQSGWLAGEAFVLWTTAATLGSYGRLGSALQHSMEALRVAQEIEHPKWMIAAQWALGQTYNGLLMADREIEHLEAGLPLARTLGSAWWLASLSASLAAAHLLRNDPIRAASALSPVLPADGQPRIMSERRVARM